MRVSLLLMRDLEWLALILALTILSFVILAATQRRQSIARGDPEREP
jgi:hypothetical protein